MRAEPPIFVGWGLGHTQAHDSTGILCFQVFPVLPNATLPSSAIRGCAGTSKKVSGMSNLKVPPGFGVSVESSPRAIPRPCQRLTPARLTRSLQPREVVSRRRASRSGFVLQNNICSHGEDDTLQFESLSHRNSLYMLASGYDTSHNIQFRL